MAEPGITEEDMRRIEDAIDNGMSRLRGRRSARDVSTQLGKDHLLEVVREMERRGFRDVTSRGLARYMDEDRAPCHIGKVMSSLATDGYVDRIGENSPYRWRLSERRNADDLE